MSHEEMDRLVMQVMDSRHTACITCLIRNPAVEDPRLDLLRALIRNGTIELPEYFTGETRGINELLSEWILDIKIPLDFDELSDHDTLMNTLDGIHQGLSDKLLGIRKWHGYVSREISDEWEVPDEEDPDLETAYETRDTDVDEGEYDTLDDVGFIKEHFYDQIDIRQEGGVQWVAFWAPGGEIDMHGMAHEFHARLRRADGQPFTERELRRIQALSGYRQKID